MFIIIFYNLIFHIQIMSNAKYDLWMEKSFFYNKINTIPYKWFFLTKVIEQKFILCDTIDSRINGRIIDRIVILKYIELKY